MKDLTLDYATWRCGGDDGLNALGKGSIVLLNDEGYMCVDGQIAKQIDPTVTDADMLKRSGFKMAVKDIALEKLSIDGSRYFVSSPLLNKLMAINDKTSTTPDEKISLLQGVLLENGYNLTVINKP